MKSCPVDLLQVLNLTLTIPSRSSGIFKNNLPKIMALNLKQLSNLIFDPCCKVKCKVNMLKVKFGIFLYILALYYLRHKMMYDPMANTYLSCPPYAYICFVALAFH